MTDFRIAEPETTREELSALHARLEAAEHQLQKAGEFIHILVKQNETFARFLVMARDVMDGHSDAIEQLQNQTNPTRRMVH